MFSLSFGKHSDKKKEKKNLLNLIIKMYIPFAGAIITSTARASFVVLLSYSNKILNQSARIFLRLFSIGLYRGNNKSNLVSVVCALTDNHTRHPIGTL